MTTKTNIARAMRKLGLSSVVDSTAFRQKVGAPVYKHHQHEQAEPTPDSRNLRPVLAVVVPAFNVENYLRECLNSVLGQSYSNLDVLIVNDGSTDSTGAIADEYARNHKRVRVIHQQNAGLGAARNAGLTHSTSQFITFVDSDDTVPPGTYERAMTTLAGTGSDVCIASVSRFDSRNKWLPFWVHLAHDEERLAIRGTDFPPIMWDVFAWNKVYRRSSWDRLVGHFPEGTLYEDQECTAKLFVGGAKLDVLKEVGYNWRLREDNSSITQQKTSVSDLRQRLDVAFKVREVISDSDESFLRYWYAKTLGEDLYYYIREVPRADNEFFDVLAEGVSRLWNDAPDLAFDAIDPIRRILAYYVAHRGRADLSRLLVRLEQTKNAYKGRIEGDDLRFSVEDEAGEIFDIPSNLQSVPLDILKPRVELVSYFASPNGDVRFNGIGFIPNFDVQYGYSADLFDPETEEIVATLEVHSVNDPVPQRLSDAYNSYHGSQFALKIPHYVVDEVAQHLESSQGSNLQLRLHLHLAKFSWTDASIVRSQYSAAAYPVASDLTNRGARIAIQGDPRKQTEIVVLKPKFVAKEIRIDENSLHVKVDQWSVDLPTFPSAPAKTGLYLSLSQGSTEIARSEATNDGNALSFELALPRGPLSLSRNLHELQLQVASSSGMRWALAINRSQTERRRDRDFTVGTTGFGYAVINRAHQVATADKIEFSTEGTSVRVTGTFTIDTDVARAVTPTFALVGARQIIHPKRTSVDHASRTFDVEFSLVGAGGKQLPAWDRYVLQLLLAAGKSHPASAWVSASYELEDSAPNQIVTPVSLITVNAIGTSRSVRIDVDQPLDPDTESGIWNKAQNSKVFLSASRSLDPSAVLFESFSGSAVADSPLALDGEIRQRRPDIKRYWTVQNPLTPVPKGAVPVVFGSREWFNVASSAKVLINNNNFPYFFHKHPDQFYIQTWHGTPLKRIGNHVPPKNLSLSYRQLMRREAEDYWDLLLAQSEWAGDTLKDAFGYEGDVLATGYPRNDALANAAQLKASRDATRKKLGINPGQRTILYAPTWRDNLKESSGHYSAVDFLGVKSAAKKLGKSSIILYRGHANSLNAAAQRLGESALDVSLYPNVNDLIAASDVLLTDYSSIMFDYVVTGKPIVFLCPDLDIYRDSVRGFYFDFEAASPGPIVKSAAEAVEILKADRQFSVDSTERYYNFVERFASLDDGYSSMRVIQEILQNFD
ncbi:CDP-glycerol glycerophosphotransferase family protein [Brevibacterium sp. CBA3109]|uniref:CDP-glycerol glycerophosphotransferase family protein n=1 Tax=Brevibacterium koreense TaxID=3140787 RepID=A0AAU7UM67_9MICO